MKNDGLRIHAALDRRLSFLDSDPARRARIMKKAHEEENTVKKKYTVSLLAAVIAIIALAGVALAIGVNVFDFFGANDNRISQLAPDSALETRAPTVVESDIIGVTRAEIGSAYYDGASLIVGYVIENAKREELFTPDAEMLKKMRRADGAAVAPIPLDYGESLDSLTIQYNKAVYAGTPFGFVQYAISPGDHTYTDDGLDLPPATERRMLSAEGGTYYLREYDNPLPDAVLNRDYLNISIPLHMYAYYYYYDGVDCYSYYESSRNIGEMSASIPRTPAETRRFAATDTYNGAEIHIDIEVSAVFAKLTLTYADGAFPDLNADEREFRWYEIVLRDENGGDFSGYAESWTNEGEIEAWFSGTGALPEQVNVYILVREGEPIESAIANIEPITIPRAE